MSLFTQFAVNALMATSHPTINRRECWTIRPQRYKCSRCVDICPQSEKIFKRPGFAEDFSACTDCGLCVSACDTRAIFPSKEQVERDGALAENRNEIVWIGCEKSQRQNDAVRDCVGAYSWEMLAFLALNKKLVLDLTPCGECENDACAQNLQRVLQRLVEFFGEPVFNLRIALAYEPEQFPYVNKELTRREMMEQVTSGSKNSTRKLLKSLPGMGGSGPDSTETAFRLLLHDRTKLIRDASKTPIRYTYSLPNVTDACYGCGRCATTCKAGAIELKTGEDGLTRFIVTPWKCSECGHCALGCLPKAIDGVKKYQLTSLGPVILRKFTQQLCEECGKPMPIDPAAKICKQCETKHRVERQRAEAKERAEKRKAELAAKKAAREAEEAAKAAAEAAALAPESVAAQSEEN